MFEEYNRKYNPHTRDVEKVRNRIASKRLLELIEEEEKLL